MSLQLSNAINVQIKKYLSEVKTVKLNGANLQRLISAETGTFVLSIVNA